ncbi:MlaD family protein [Thiohalorhabdus sp. Cl-TMA]|uniref:MlaD family protein n=1 Tax=Thiohalorhabdus methylotrophus TaxID=3242694 RepID=A0ABV4TQW0_9GAMM
MERDVRYITVGIVVILTGIGFFLFLLWFSQNPEGEDFEQYSIYFQGSVGGLDAGSEVQYQGVEVGRVIAIEVLEDRPRFIRVHIQVSANTPVNRTTVATSRSVGFTGLAYVGLETREADAPPPRKPPGERFAVLDSRPSRLEQVFEDLPKILKRIENVARRAERLLGKDTERQVHALLKGANRLTENLNGRVRELSGIMDRTRETLAGVDRTLTGTRKTMRAARQVLPEAEAALGNLRALSGRLDRFLAQHRGDLDRFTSEGLEELRLFLEDGRATLKEVRELSRRLKENPSQLIYQPGAEGVEIPQ